MEITKALFFRFFSESDYAMAILEGEGFIIASNRAFEHLLASLSASAVPRNPDFPEDPESDPFPRSIRDILGPRQTSLFWASLSRLVNGELKETNFETELHPRHEEPGVTHWYNFHTWLVENGLEGPGPSIGIIIEDKTRLRMEEKRLLEDKEIAEKATEAKTRFLANMSHEIRTPIQTIIGMTEFLRDTVLDDRQSEYSAQIQFSAEALLALINDILDYSKIEAGKMELEHIPFELREAIEQAAEMIAPEARKKGLEMTVHIPRELRLTVRGDPNKFRQILINLIKNAVKFTQTGGITVSAEPATLRKGKALRMAVADTGIGINEKARARLFTTFSQADVSDSRRFGGTGLGLAICRELVELMKGRIEMIPNEKGGSVFRFTIPLEPEIGSSALPPEGTAGAVNPGEANYFPPIADGAGKREKSAILIAEDHPVNQKLFAMIAEKLGFTAILADDGQYALEKAETLDPELIFMDIQMPRINGYEAAEKLRERGFRKPIIAVTASVFPEERERWFRCGINDILLKPFRQADIKKILRKWLPAREDAAGLAQAPEPPATKVESGPLETPQGFTEEIFSLRDLRSSFMNNDEIARSLLVRFIERTDSQIERILAWRKAEDWKTAYREAHTIKGASLTLGGKELGKAAGRMELAFKNIDRAEIEAAYDPLREAFGRFKNAAEEFIQSA